MENTPHLHPFYSPKDKIIQTEGNLPHWHQNGKLQFVTFRLADSLPQEKLQQWKEEKEQWLQAHPEPWTKEQTLAYQRYFGERMDCWLDANYGACILRRPTIHQIVEDAILFYNHQHYIIHDYAIMPNHVHILLEMLDNHTLMATLHSLKSFTAHKINKTLCAKGDVWQHESFDRLVRNKEHYVRVRAYIAGNLHTPLGTDDLAAFWGMSPKTT